MRTQPINVSRAKPRGAHTHLRRDAALARCFLVKNESAAGAGAIAAAANKRVAPQRAELEQVRRIALRELVPHLRGASVEEQRVRDPPAAVRRERALERRHRAASLRHFLEGRHRDVA